MQIFFSSLVITLREGIEAALAIAIVLMYLRKTGRARLATPVWLGLVLAVAASVGGAILLEHVPVNGELLEGTLMLVAALFVGTMILWMWKASKGLKKEIESKIEEITSESNDAGKGMWLGLFGFTFLMIFREGLETVIFLKAVNFSTESLLSFIGGITGILLAVAFGVFFVRGSIRIDLGRFFKITGIVLILFVIQLVIGGFHELAEGGLFDIGPTEMAVIGPFVKNNALFMMGILLIPFLMFLIPAQKKPVATAATGSRADQRLQLAQEKRQKVWRVMAAALSLIIVLFIGYDFVYGQSNRRLSDPVVVNAEGGFVRIPLTALADHDFHRFQLSGTHVRFIVLKTDDGVTTALDACEICGAQGYNYESGTLICLNCDADINKATVGQSGGCNPVPLKSKVEGGALVISADELQKEEARFAK